jgi:post-segregation antitoxin (ccd killing protein)
MPKVSVYLPDELYRRARERKLPISSLAQEAIEAALRLEHNARWVARQRARPRRVGPPIDIEKLMDEVRDEFGT